MNDFKNIIEGVLIKENFQIIGSWPTYVHGVRVTEALNGSPARLVRYVLWKFYKNIQKLQPASNAHLVPAFEVALSLFADYDAHRTAEFQPELDDHWMWYITNGHLQCADCICYPEIGDPDFYQKDVTTSMDTSQFETAKMAEFRLWMSHSSNIRNWFRTLYILYISKRMLYSL